MHWLLEAGPNIETSIAKVILTDSVVLAAAFLPVSLHMSEWPSPYVAPSAGIRHHRQTSNHVVGASNPEQDILIYIQTWLTYRAICSREI